MIDFITTNDSNKQISIGYSDEQQMQALLAFCKGWNKFAPFVGACLFEELHNQIEPETLYARIRHELVSDGAELQDLQLQKSDTQQLQLRLAATYHAERTPLTENNA